VRLGTMLGRVLAATAAPGRRPLLAATVAAGRHARGFACAVDAKPLLRLRSGARGIATADLPLSRGRRAFSSSGAVQVKTPEFGAESITEGTLQEWSKKAGEYVEKGDLLALIETDKVSVEVRAEVSGILAEVLVPPDETVQVGQALATITPGGAPPAKSAEAPKAPTPKAAPAAAPAVKPAPASAPAPSASAGPARAEKRVKLTRMRKAIARSMKDAQESACMLTTFQEVDMSGIMGLRAKYKDEFEDTHGVRLGFMGAFVKASAFALKQIPSVNAVIDGEKNEIVYRDYCDVSVAVASPKGLVVPVIRDAQSLSINQIESEIGNLALRARNDELGMEDMMGGTFTITNGGVFGSLLSTPILNCGFGPQSAILGMHFTKQRPVVLSSGEIAARPVMYLALTYDHRMVDGREAVTFLCMVRDQIEDPRRLMLEL